MTLAFVFKLWLNGHVIKGAVTSNTVIVNDLMVCKPTVSSNVYVTVVTPTGKSEPDVKFGVGDDTGAAIASNATLSVAVGVFHQ